MKVDTRGAVAPDSGARRIRAIQPIGTVKRSVVASLLVLPFCFVPALRAQTLNGSHASMVRQNSVAHHNDYTFLRTPSQVRRFVKAGYLVKVPGNRDYALRDVSYPYARPEVKLFVERLAAEYHDACGEKLIVTSLTRPLDRQPWNAHVLSVHPTGMALDLHRSSRRACRNWLEDTLLELEDAHLLDVTREHHPSHYHVAVFPQRYEAYVARLLARDDSGASDSRADNASEQ